MARCTRLFMDTVLSSRPRLASKRQIAGHGPEQALAHLRNCCSSGLCLVLKGVDLVGQNLSLRAKPNIQYVDENGRPIRAEKWLKEHEDLQREWRDAISKSYRPEPTKGERELRDGFYAAQTLCCATNSAELLLGVEPSGAAALEGALKFIGEPPLLGLLGNSCGIGLAGFLGFAHLGQA